MLRKLSLLILLAALVLSCTGCPLLYSLIFRNTHTFTSADLSRNQWRWYDMSPSAADDNAGGEGEGEGEADPREVVEPDVIRRSGNLLYVLNQYRGLTIVDLNEQKTLAQVPTNGYPRDLYITQGRAYVLVGQASDYTVDGNLISFDVASRLYVVDTSTPRDAVILDAFALEGDLIDSRLVGNVLYAVCAKYEWYWEDTGDTVTNSDVVKAQTSESWVTSVNVADPANIYEADKVSAPGSSTVIQATDTAIFMAASNWSSNTTDITYVDISDAEGQLAIRGSITIQGQVADRFKMDVYQGVLRVVSNGWWSDRRVYINTIDLANPDTLSILGTFDLANAVGETLFATRFDGPRAYIVTYLVKDPLFVIDLANPAAPAVLGELEVPGWSTHIEPMGDRLIALGVDDTENQRRVCVSLFDVADVAKPALLDRVSFGENWAWSSAYSDVKAFTVLDGLLIVPFSGWRSDYGGYDRLQFITYNGNDLDAKGAVDMQGSILRSFAYNGNYYGVTTEQLATIDAADLMNPHVTSRLTLAEYVDDFIEINPSLAAEIVVAYGEGVTRVRMIGLEKQALGEAVIKLTSLSEAFVHGDQLVLAGTAYGTWGDNGWTEPPHYEVVVVNCADPAAPAASDPIKIDIEPYWTYYNWRYDYLTPMLDKQTQDAMYYWYMPWTPQSSIFLIGDALVVRGHKDTYAAYLGEKDDAYQGLAVLDLNNPAFPYTTVGLGYKDIISIDAAGNKLYVGTQVSSQTSDAAGDVWSPICSYYLREIDPIQPLAGPVVNVPGMFVSYIPENDLLILKDYQWGLTGQLNTYLRTVAWNGDDTLTVIDSTELPSGVRDVIGRGARVYYDLWDNGYNLYSAKASILGQWKVADGIKVTDRWTSIIGASNDSIYFSIGNAVARYTFASDQGELDGLLEVMGWPQGIRMGSENAFISLGYSGVIMMPL